MVHPLLPTPSGAYDDPVYLDIRALEPEPEFNEVFNAISRYGLFLLPFNLMILFLNKSLYKKRNWFGNRTGKPK